VDDHSTRRIASVGSTISELRKAIQTIADECRFVGAGHQAEKLEEVKAKLETPKLAGIVAELAHPLYWPTREYALWMAERLTVAGTLIQAFLDDAEITGSTETSAAGKDWLESLGFAEPRPPDPVVDPEGDASS
jgi:hypothetical protein